MPTKAYTIAHVSLDELLESGETRWRLGMIDRATGEQRIDGDTPYDGASVFRTPGRALAFRGSAQWRDQIPHEVSVEECAVYEIELPNDWATDVTSPHPRDGVCRLINDAKITRRVSQ